MPFQGSIIDPLPGLSRSLSMANPQREQAAFDIRIRGAPRDDVYLFSSAETDFRVVPGYRGVQLTQQPGPATFLGVIPESGVLSTTLSIPDLGPGVQSRIDYFQAAHHDTQGVWTFGSPVSLVVLDQAF